MVVGYCTLTDIRLALRKADLPGDIGQDKLIAIDAIEGEREPLEKELSRHFYAEQGDMILDRAEEIDIPTEPLTRDDEHDLSRWGAMVHGADERDRHRYKENSDALLESDPRSDRWRKNREEPKRQVKIATGDEDALEPPVDESRPAYTEIELDRRDAQAVNKLEIIGADGAYTDWVASDDYSGGVGREHRGEDYWVRINNGGESLLYIDVHSLDDDIASLSNAVYIDFGYGHVGIPPEIRRAVAHRAAAQFTEDAVIEIPNNATVYNIETKADEMRSEADRLISEYRED